MKKFLLGVVVGIVLSAGASVLAAGVFGEDGFLLGWDVQKDGETVCSDPYIWISAKEIECD